LAVGALKPLPTLSTRKVLHNAGLLVVAQAIATPIAVVVNALAARKLGAADFGSLYQALTFSAFAFLFVEWGQPNVLMARVAMQHDSSGRLLGSALVFRLAMSALAILGVSAVCLLARYDARFITLMALVMVGSTFATLSGACQDVLRGYERADFAAACFVGWQILSAAVVVPTLLLGGGIYGFLLAQVACAAVGCLFVISMLPRLGVPSLAVTTSTIKDLFRSGGPFLTFGLVLLLQPLVDAAMLSRLAPAEDLGWYAAARKLVGVAVYPASALVLALYPTLCRVRTESMTAYRDTMAEALYAVTLLVVPVALGCALFPGLGVAIFGQEAYGPAQDDLRVLAAYVALVYFSMPIGSCLVSSGRQNAWTAVQFVCVLVSVALDPPLIRWFHARAGNGGLGVCVSAVVSEILMVAGGLAILPTGVLAKPSRPKLAAVVLSGAAMTAVALGGIGLVEWLRALAAVIAYGVCLQLLGGFNFLQTRSFLRALRG
jgi:O-antigen/teichoic acid export membrane protein